MFGSFGFLHKASFLSNGGLYVETGGNGVGEGGFLTFFQHLAFRGVKKRRNKWEANKSPNACRHWIYGFFEWLYEYPDGCMKYLIVGKGKEFSFGLLGVFVCLYLDCYTIL